MAPFDKQPGTSAEEAERKELEKQFFDQRYELDTRASLQKFYAIQKSSSRQQWQDFLRSSAPGKHVLEYGCGDTPQAISLASFGARVTAIDISPVAVERARAEAVSAGFEEIAFEAMDAEQLAFDDDTFDLVCGTAILHHLDLTRSLSEITRVLKPGGTAFFLEPMGHNPAINLYRKRTPQHRTPDEHPLTMSDLKLAGEFFEETQFDFYHLLSLAAIPFRRARFFPRAVQALDRADQALFRRVPGARALAWQVIMTLERPRKGGVRN